ncbi:MAG: glycosyltransferase [Promethearchaeota archaeon]|nr:MAG: glycosyltransferase [Candidatus Lokiarchaeota archaeon]
MFVSFENHYAPWGGLAAVMKMLPPVMSEKIPTIVISPFFSNIKKTQASIQEGKLIKTELDAMVLYKGYKHKITLYKSTEYPTLQHFDFYLIQCDKFFLAGQNPYNDTWRFDSLFHDSYFFSKSVPVALSLLQSKYPPPYILNLQDWETALVADSMPYNLPNKCVLTLHNPYDTYLIDDPEKKTVLEYTIPKLQGLSTVSEQFAYELLHDPLQTEVVSRKLQGQFQYMNPIGINNGNFVPLSFPEQLRDPDAILSEKLKSRRLFNSLLNETEEIKPQWGAKCDLMRSDRPIFLIFGRDDPKQKGFDVAAVAIYRLLKEVGLDTGHFIFTPLPSTEDLDSLAYLEDLCEEFSHNVMVFPFRLSKGYDHLLKAANFIIMPSYYEPFGAANEAYASGTPVIARATGGLIQQVCPLNYTSLPARIQKYINGYHADVTKATGYLYREHPSTETADNWKYILSTDFSARRSIQEPIDWRNPLFWSMVTELENTLKMSIKLYRTNKQTYGNLVLKGIELFQRFSWKKSAERYRKQLYLVE